jgi:integrase
MDKRSSRAGTEDRWHRPARRNEEVAWPADGSDGPLWCNDPKHGTPGTLVCTGRHGQGKRWLARWVDHDGQERSKAFDRKAYAQHHITEVTSALNTGMYADPRRGATTFAAVAEPWFNSKSGLVAKTQAGYRSLLDVVVLPRWGEVKLSDIHHADIQAWVHALATDPATRQRKSTKPDAKGLSPSRVVQAFQVVDQVLRYAVRARFIAVNPADGVQLPRVNTPEKIALTHDQVRALADASGELRTAVYVLGYSGLRYGELAALRVGDVDASRRRLKVSRSATAVAKLGIVEGTTKTHQTRAVPLPLFVMDMVTTVIDGRAPDELVFPYHDGSWMPRDWFALRLDKASAVAGLVGVTPHILRHTAGSLALASGASVVTVQKLLGHQSAITTMNVYGHQMPDDFDNLAAAMDTAARAAAS